MKQALTTPLTFTSSIFEIIRTPKMVLYLIPPYIIGIVAVYLSFGWISDLVSLKLSTLFIVGDMASSWYGEILNKVISLFVSFISLLLAGLLSALAGIAALSILAGYFVECFIELALARYNLPKSTESGFIKSTLRGMRDELKRLVIIFSTLIIATLLTFIFPLLAPIALLLGIIIIGYEIFDLPLALIGLDLKQRLKLSREKILEVMVLGFIFTLIAAIPGLPIIFLPVGYLTAIRNISRWPELSEWHSPK